MKRSEINIEINKAKQLFKNNGILLPPFAFWTRRDWSQKGREVGEIVDNMLGWDVTDYGGGDFDKTGLLLFTMRNGNSKKKDIYTKTYAEKIMVVKEDQLAPMHFHWHKQEDIINRGGGDLVIVLYQSTADEKLSSEPLSATIDGVKKTFKAGEEVVLTPGESICLIPRMYHAFYGRRGTGSVVVGEVSEVNDDMNDNRFHEPIGRFPEIEEDVAAQHPLCTEYEQWITTHS